MAGTVAIPVLSVVRLNVNPPTGAGAEICKLIFWVPASITDIAAGEKLESTVTSATLISGAKPVAVPVICTDPINMPVICGFAAGTCNPSGINTLDVTVAMAGLLLVKFMINPPAGAA